ncbi:hypothetical protein Pmi06nite_29000 [Planotetraspora mira]|uniref:Uncharacterized protein n=1 Tax=Planotetraspora mira TaxID=58121 RepID=A0A8J3TN33_9ACTN|nr:hypothetical protein Pmi06nite_29000 [Planotetraspora mira]
MLYEARRFVMSLRARSALEFAGQWARFASRPAHWQQDMSMDVPRPSPTVTASLARRRDRANRDYPGIPDA